MAAVKRTNPSRASNGVRRRRTGSAGMMSPKPSVATVTNDAGAASSTNAAKDRNARYAPRTRPRHAMQAITARPPRPSPPSSMPASCTPPMGAPGERATAAAHLGQAERSPGHRVDDESYLEQLRRQPVIGQVQVDPSGLDRRMTGLGPARPRVPSRPPRSRVRQVCLSPWQAACANQARRRAPVNNLSNPRLTTVSGGCGPEHHEHLVGVVDCRPLGLEVGRGRGEEP